MCDEFTLMKEQLKSAKLGSFLLVPLKYDEQFNKSWLEENGQLTAITTMDINESVKKSTNGNNSENVIERYIINREKVAELLLGSENSNTFYACPKTEQYFSTINVFDVMDIEIYIFHTQVAFLRVKIKYSNLRLLNIVCNFGFAENDVTYYYTDKNGDIKVFDFEGELKNICRLRGLELFFSEKSALFLESYVYTTAVVPQRFKEIETMRQATFNLHLMGGRLEDKLEDRSEEDINYVYAVKNQPLGTYRWGCCVTSQTISYIVANESMDIDAELKEQSENGIPVALLALYQKYTCLRFKELISIADDKKTKRLKKLKKQLLEFQAYGTITPANLSRWHNVRQTYKHILDTNGVPQAIDDISITLNLLVERQKETETAKADAIMGLITIFSIVSIPTSIIGLLDVLMGGNSMNIITAVVSLVSIIFVIILMLLYKERT